MSFEFPSRLLALQAQLHRVHAEHTALCATLPWSAQPLPGWTGQEGRYSLRGDVPPSPGYTEEQQMLLARLERRLRRLTSIVVTDAFWQSVFGGVNESHVGGGFGSRFGPSVQEMDNDVGP